MTPEQLAAFGHAVLTVVVQRANAGAPERRTVLPSLSLQSDRATLILWLKGNDPNGEYDDPKVWHESPDGLLDEGWWVATSDERRCFGTHERAARTWAESERAPIDDLWWFVWQQTEGT